MDVNSVTVQYERANIEKRGIADMDNREKLSGQNGKWNIGAGGDMPIGFGLSLAANEKSMEAFAKMSDAEKERTVERSRQQHTRVDMERFVNSLGETKS